MGFNPARSELPGLDQLSVFISYAWADEASPQSQRWGGLVERMCNVLARDGWDVRRDKGSVKPGGLISDFMKFLTRGDRVIVVLSDAYLRSSHCMTELYGIYHRSLGEKEDFLRRIIPLTLHDVRIDNWRDRFAYAEHWMAEFKALDAKLADAEGRQILGRGAYEEYRAMQRWYMHISDMLQHINDVLNPHGFENIRKNRFLALRQMLDLARSEGRQLLTSCL